jgi:hypothetical protein
MRYTTDPIDSRDLIEEAQALAEQHDDPDSPDLTLEDRERLAAIQTLADEVGSEWEYGATLIPEDGFEDYARDLAMDYGAVTFEGITFYVRTLRNR